MVYITSNGLINQFRLRTDSREETNSVFKKTMLTPPIMLS